MSSTTSSRSKRPLCSAFSVEAGENPAGSAPSWEQCLVLEFPTPWRFDVLETPHFPTDVRNVLDQVDNAGRNTRLQCVNPDPEYSVDGKTRVMLFTRPDGPFTRFRREEYVVPAEMIGDLVDALLLNRDELGNFSKFTQKTENIRDIFVCTHGARDTCCASFGTPIYQALRNKYASKLGGSLRVWRMSHIGGHRLAPNLIDMPDGRNWVRITESQLKQLVFRENTPSPLASNYRGLIGLDSPFEMIAESEVFMKEGWDMVGQPISTEMSFTSVDEANVRLTSTNLSSGPLTYAVKVIRSGTVEYIKCLGDGTVEEEDQYIATDIAKID